MRVGVSGLRVQGFGLAVRIEGGLLLILRRRESAFPRCTLIKDPAAHVVLLASAGAALLITCFAVPVVPCWPAPSQEAFWVFLLCTLSKLRQQATYLKPFDLTYVFHPGPETL